MKKNSLFSRIFGIFSKKKKNIPSERTMKTPEKKTPVERNSATRLQKKSSPLSPSSKQQFDNDKTITGDYDSLSHSLHPDEPDLPEKDASSQNVKTMIMDSRVIRAEMEARSKRKEISLSQKSQVPAETVAFEASELLAELGTKSEKEFEEEEEKTPVFTESELISQEQVDIESKFRPVPPEEVAIVGPEHVDEADETITTMVENEILDDTQRILRLTEKRFPELSDFMENLLHWINENLGPGLLEKSLKQIIAADVEFELDADDFILRFLEGLEVNNLSPVIKIITLRAKNYLDLELATQITDAVNHFALRLRTDRLVEIFPWQKRRSQMRKILEAIDSAQQNIAYDELEKTTREKTKELTIRKWLTVVSEPHYYSIENYEIHKHLIVGLHDEFRKSTAETQVLVLNLDEMLAKAEFDKTVQSLTESIISKIVDLQDRKARLTENLYSFLEGMPKTALEILQKKLQSKKELDVFTFLRIIESIEAEELQSTESIELNLFKLREELRVKEALKRMYFISRAYNHEMLTRTLLIQGCLAENDDISYEKKVGKIKKIYGFDLPVYLQEQPFNPNSTKAKKLGEHKYTLQFEEKKSESSNTEEMTLYQEGTLLAMIEIPLPGPLDNQLHYYDEYINYLHKVAFSLELLINFYHSRDEIFTQVRKNSLDIWNNQGLHSLHELVANNQKHFLQLDSQEFGYSAFQNTGVPGIGAIIGKMADDIFIPLLKEVEKILEL